MTGNDPAGVWFNEDRATGRNTAMKARQIHESSGQRTFAVILDAGDEVMAALDHIDHERTVAAFSGAQIAAPTIALADRLQALAADLQVSLGTIAS